MEAVYHMIRIGTFQGFLLLSALIIKNLGKRNLNHFFFILVGLLSFALLAKLLFSREAFEWMPHFWYVLDLAAFAIGPLWYLTIKKSLNTKAKLSNADLWLLSPTLQYTGFVFYAILGLSPSELILAGDRDALFIRISFYLFCLSLIFVNGSFLYKSYRLIHRNKGLPLLFRHGQKLFLTVLVVWMGIFITAMIFYWKDIRGVFLAYDLGFLSLAFIVFAWGYLALLKPEYFYFLTQTYSGSENFVLNEIARRAVDEIESHQLFLDKSFNLRTLAERVGSNTVMTSKAINRVLGISFSDLVNRYRVKHFLRLAREENKRLLTHWALAQESGFGNKVSFYRHFRKETGSTPKAFLDNVPE